MKVVRERKEVNLGEKVTVEMTIRELLLITAAYGKSTTSCRNNLLTEYARNGRLSWDVCNKITDVGESRIHQSVYEDLIAILEGEGVLTYGV